MSSPTVSYSIHYDKSETSEPVYVAGSFSNPPWLPQKMRRESDSNGSEVFAAEIKAEPGRNYQYKIRIGDEDNWVLDQAVPVVTDEAGNQNNLLVIPRSLPNRHLSVAGDGSPRSRTPIKQVADTAAEVADTAEKLDADDDGEQNRSHFFAHECPGGYDLGSSDVEDLSDRSPRTSKSLRESFMAEIDVKDPTLEKFPSDGPSIMDTLRKLQTSTGDNHLLVDSHQPSSHGPSNAVSSRTSIESMEDSPMASGSLSPNARRRDSRSPHGSFSTSKSAVSLGSIAEEESKTDSGSGAKGAPKHLQSPFMEL